MPSPLSVSSLAPRRLAGAVLAALALLVAFAAAPALADSAPQQWQPTAADQARAVRNCPMQVQAPVQPVCWSMTEDKSAWMAQPAGSPYPWGQCTYYVGVMRPDVWNDRAAPSADPMYQDWDAWTWVEHAQVEGLGVDDSPQSGDVMVYSRAAVNNSTGHVAIVDGVDGTDSGTGDLILTVSEMNVEGLDDASQGQGDTMEVEVPKSQLVPGMIQFIHRPGSGYTPPSWPAGSGGTSSGAGASVSDNPSLALDVADNTVQTISQSPAQVQAVVTALPGGTVVKRVSFSANQSVALGLPTGSYQVCVSQAATGEWAAASACASASWQGPAQTVHLHVSGLHATSSRLSFSLAPGAGTATAAASTATATSTPTATTATVPRYAARVVITARQSVRVGHRRVMRTRTVYRATVQVSAGRQAITLPRAVRRLARHTVLGVTVTVPGGHDVDGASAHVAVKV